MPIGTSLSLSQTIRDDSNNTVRWYVYDGLGSVLGEVDPNGNLTARRKYDVYGVVRSGDTGSSKQKFVGSLGHASEDETGLIYMRARYYDPQIGRFASEDPARDGMNWFAYCSGDPVNCVDESGHDDSKPSNLEAWLGRLTISVLGLIIGYFLSQILIAVGASLAVKYLVLGLWAALTSATSGQFGPTLFRDIKNFLKGVDKIDKGDGGTGANGITKATLLLLSIRVAEIYGELLTQDFEQTYLY